MVRHIWECMNWCTSSCVWWGSIKLHEDNLSFTKTCHTWGVGMIQRSTAKWPNHRIHAASHPVPHILSLKSFASHPLPHILYLISMLPHILCLTCCLTSCASHPVPHILCLRWRGDRHRLDLPDSCSHDGLCSTNKSADRKHEYLTQQLPDPVGFGSTQLIHPYGLHSS